MGNNKFFSGKTAWITGASSGIGKGLVHALLEKGASLIISSNDADGLERVKSEYQGYSQDILPVPFDLSDTDGIITLVDDVMKKTGRIDYLLNIGGVSQRASVTDTPLWLDRKIFEINYFGTIALTKAVLPYMIRQGAGYIAATSSISGRFGFPLRSAYSASKQALHGFFETLYLENKKNNIRTSVIIPGRVKTSISLHALDHEGKEHGRMDEGQSKGISPERAARIIIRGILRNKREITVGGSELLMLYVRKYCPWLFFRIGDKISST